jgi:hypothetical protein
VNITNSCMNLNTTETVENFKPCIYHHKLMCYEHAFPCIVHVSCLKVCTQHSNIQMREEVFKTEPKSPSARRYFWGNVPCLLKTYPFASFHCCLLLKIRQTKDKRRQIICFMCWQPEILRRLLLVPPRPWAQSPPPPGTTLLRPVCGWRKQGSASTTQHTSDQI